MPVYYSPAPTTAATARQSAMPSPIPHHNNHNYNGSLFGNENAIDNSNVNYHHPAPAQAVTSVSGSVYQICPEDAFFKVRDRWCQTGHTSDRDETKGCTFVRRRLLRRGWGAGWASWDAVAH